MDDGTLCNESNPIPFVQAKGKKSRQKDEAPE
jgi:hypothetical protein